MASLSFVFQNPANTIQYPPNPSIPNNWPNPFQPSIPFKFANAKKHNDLLPSINDDQCSCCGERIWTDRNWSPCANCGVMDSDRHRREATAFYLLGVTNAPLISRLPHKTPFFIYPLASPEVSYYLKFDANEILIRFVVTLSDTKRQTNYIVSKIRFVIQSSTNSHLQGQSYILDKPSKPGTFQTRFAEPYEGQHKLKIEALIQYKIGRKTYRKTSPKVMLSMNLKRHRFYHEEQLKNYIISHATFEKQKHTKHEVKYDELQLIQLRKQHDDYQLVYGEFLRSSEMIQSDVETIIIYKIRNKYRQDAYQSKKNQMLKLLKNDITLLHEDALYHGTDILTVIKILHQGFLRQFAARAVFGKGSYFAKNARYSCNQSYAKPDGDRFQHLLLCNVICGEWTVGSSSMKIPPIKPTSEHLPYETTVNSESNPTVFVTYQDDQALPTYLISFRRK
eukprot:55297_1